MHGRGAEVDEDRLRFHALIPARGTWSTNIIVTPLVEQRLPPDRFVAAVSVSDLEAARRHRAWGKAAPRLELANGDSPATDGVFSHPYHPSLMGTDTIHHDAAHASCILLPVVPRI